MKKLLQLLFSIAILSNTSYASFPVSNKLTIKQETYQTEVIKNNLKQPINKHKNVLKVFLFSAFIGLIMAFYGILSPSMDDIGIGLFGGAIFIASILGLVINFLLKRINKKQ
tara:strand:- start:968 stop:1303 length:336 start_codon:yes stop_codon:yes gene_type:complete